MRTAGLMKSIANRNVRYADHEPLEQVAPPPENRGRGPSSTAQCREKGDLVELRRDDGRCRRRSPRPRAGGRDAVGMIVEPGQETPDSADGDAECQWERQQIASGHRQPSRRLIHSTAMSPPISPPTIDLPPRRNVLSFHWPAKSAGFSAPGAGSSRPPRTAATTSQRVDSERYRRQRGRDAAEVAVEAGGVRQRFKDGVRMEREAPNRR